MTSMHGTWSVASTPFLADGSPEDRSQPRLVDAAIGWGVDGLTLMGVMSEVATLSADEWSAALRATCADRDR
jgi:4-hydroxy-tetrahydrodipicolinate synthase